MSAEFTQFEKDVEIKKNGIERYVPAYSSVSESRTA